MTTSYMTFPTQPNNKIEGQPATSIVAKALSLLAEEGIIGVVVSMETSLGNGEMPNQNPINPRSNVILVPSSSSPVWPTIDGPLGLSEEDSVSYARRFYKFGFALLPWLWALNCFYFWPALRHSRSFPRIHHYVLRSAVGLTVFTALLASWALTFVIGGERLFGHVWDQLVMYNLADRLGLTGWS